MFKGTFSDVAAKLIIIRYEYPEKLVRCCKQYRSVPLVQKTSFLVFLHTMLIWIQKSVYEKKKEETSALNDSMNNGLPRLPDQKEYQAPKLFLRAASACKVRFDETPMDEYTRSKEKTDGDILIKKANEMKVKPFVHENKRRPSSRSKFDESALKIATDHFVCWRGLTFGMLFLNIVYFFRNERIPRTIP